MKIVITFLISCIILFGGCNKQSNNYQSVKYSDNPSALLEGFSLEEFGFDIKADVDFVDPNLDYDPYSTYETISGNSDYIMGDFAKDDLLGSFTYLCVLTVETKLSVTEIPIKYLQAFKIIDLKDTNNLIKVQSNNYTWEDLKKYEIYHDSSVVIFDFTDFIMEGSYDQSLEKYRSDGFNYDFAWPEAVYQYFNDHIEKCIKQQ